MEKSILLLWLFTAFIAQAKDKHHRHMALKTSLVAYWDFEQDPLFYPIHDQSEHGTHLITGTLGAPALVDGKINKGVEVTGNKVLGANSNTGISHQGNPFTVTFWFKPLALTSPSSFFGFGTGEYIIGMRASGGDYFVEFELDPDGIDLVLDVTDVPLAIGQWYFIAFGYYTNNGSFAWVSVNLSDRVRLAAPIPPTPRLFVPPSLFGDGVYDEMAIWRRNVTANELRQIYNKGDGLPFSEWDAVDDCNPVIDCCN